MPASSEYRRKLTSAVAAVAPVQFGQTLALGIAAAHPPPRSTTPNSYMELPQKMLDLDALRAVPPRAPSMYRAKSASLQGRKEAGARIRTTDLLITNLGGTMSEAPVFCGFLQCNQQGVPFSLSAVFNAIGRFSIAN